MTATVPEYPADHAHTPGRIHGIEPSRCIDIDVSVCAVCWRPIQLDWTADQPEWQITWAAAAYRYVQLSLVAA